MYRTQPPFDIQPNQHILRGFGCAICAGNAQLSTEEFIIKSKKKYGVDRLDYSQCVYKNEKDKVRLRCIEHNHSFDIAPRNHIRQGVGCAICTGNVKSTTNEFIIKSKKKYGLDKLDYSQCVYTSSITKVRLRCIEHNHSFDILPNNHLRQNMGCAKCAKCGYSKKQLDYIAYISQSTITHIIHAGNGTEFKIDGIGKVDGYCEKNKYRVRISW